MVSINELFTLEHSMAGSYLASFQYPWEALEGIKGLILQLGESLGPEYKRLGEHIWVHETAAIAPTAYLGAPCIIGAGTEVRHCAYIRGSALIGEDCVVGNSVEIKNAILFDGVQVPHYNYVGDSILGYRAHMGAGSVTSNVRGDRALVIIHDGSEELPTGRKKVGAMLGDYAEIGCNSVLNPGTVIGRRSSVYPTACVRGVIPADCIYKANGKLVRRRAK